MVNIDHELVLIAEMEDVLAQQQRVGRHKVTEKMIAAAFADLDISEDGFGDKQALTKQWVHRIKYLKSKSREAGN